MLRNVKRPCVFPGCRHACARGDDRGLIMRELATQISLPCRLDVAPIVDGDGARVYELVALLVHQCDVTSDGVLNRNAGHYVAVVRVKDRWCCSGAKKPEA